ncbi:MULTISPECIES: hypothetical protein [unclassified Mesorhizobium]|uniref:hypothetical protein n=1 Tax=unclassified Mesorhizobium TaxID=325217 RepID=UPI0015E3D1D3|nr:MULTISPECIES: hypothetical protein [unclassified Mesorhizobium]
MSGAPGTLYIVSAYDSIEKVWKTVLPTRDKAEAEAMKEAMEQDGVKASIETFPPKR